MVFCCGFVGFGVFLECFWGFRVLILWFCGFVYFFGILRFLGFALRFCGFNGCEFAFLGAVFGVGIRPKFSDFWVFPDFDFGFCIWGLLGFCFDSALDFGFVLLCVVCCFRVGCFVFCFGFIVYDFVFLGGKLIVLFSGGCVIV